MKKPTLTFLTLCALVAPSFAGGVESKEIMQQAPPPCEWYRAHEWDLNLWGAYAFSANTDDNDFRVDAEFDGHRFTEDTGTPPGKTDPVQHIDIGSARDDRFLNRDNAWGGGADVKFFFSKYWGLGIEGFVVDANSNSAGGGVGTFTIRFPIGCSRFAPYAWGGGGGAGGGSHSVWFFNENHHVNGGGRLIEHEFRKVDSNLENKHTEALGQFGAGFEVRITPRVGVMTDFAWNLLDGPDNNFGMVRFGATLSY